MPESSKLKNAVPVGQNFFYNISKTYNERSYHYHEYGIGELYRRGRGTYLRREYCFSVEDDLDQYNPRNGKPPVISMKNHESMLITSYIPEDYRKIFVSPNSVLCSTEQFVPTPVELQNNTVLGMKDGQIQEINGVGLRAIITDNEIVKAVSNTQKTITLQTRTLELAQNSRLSTSTIHLSPSPRPKHAKRGTIRFNDADDCFEGYDGVQWRALLWEKHEGSG